MRVQFSSLIKLSGRGTESEGRFKKKFNQYANRLTWSGQESKNQKTSTSQETSKHTQGETICLNICFRSELLCKRIQYIESLWCGAWLDTGVSNPETEKHGRVTSAHRNWSLYQSANKPNILYDQMIFCSP